MTNFWLVIRCRLAKLKGPLIKYEQGVGLSYSGLAVVYQKMGNTEKAHEYVTAGPFT